MLISPSVASGNALRLAEEVDFADEYFSHVHLDVEDGVAVNNISFGMKTCKQICQYSTSYKSLHLETQCPLNYLEDVAGCGVDIVFIQTDHLKDPLSIIRSFKDKGIKTALSISNRDNREGLHEFFEICDGFLVLTAKLEDEEQKFDPSLYALAKDVAKKTNKNVWIDGGITWELMKALKDDPIYAAVMGRGVFADKEKCLKLSKELGLLNPSEK